MYFWPRCRVTGYEYYDFSYVNVGLREFTEFFIFICLILYYNKLYVHKYAKSHFSSNNTLTTVKWFFICHILLSVFDNRSPFNIFYFFIKSFNRDLNHNGLLHILILSHTPIQHYHSHLFVLIVLVAPLLAMCTYPPAHPLKARVPCPDSSLRLSTVRIQKENKKYIQNGIIKLC